MDYVLNHKAVFKEHWDTAGTALTQVGVAGVAVTSQMRRGRDRNVAMAVSGGVALLGALARITAAHVEPRADTRQVRNLPDAVHVTVMPRPIGARTVTYKFVDASGAVAGTVVRDLPDAKPHCKGTLVWARSAPHLVSGRQTYGPEQWRHRAVAR